MKSCFGVFCLSLLLGCGGGGGPTLYQLKGEVKFDGKPVVHGRVEFEPDTTKGNSGGMGYADIVDGKYDTSTASGRGVIGGPHIIHVTGSDSKPPAAGPDGTLDEIAAAEAPSPKLLFSDYKLEQDLAKENGELNIDVPAAAGLSNAPSPANRPAVPDP